MNAKIYNYEAQSTLSMPSINALQAAWWVFALRGIASIFLASLAFSMPVVAVLAITAAFGIYAMIDGVFYLIAGLSRVRSGQHWGTLVLGGLASMVVGLIMLIVPQVASVALAFFFWSMFAVWAIAMGGFEITTAIRLRRLIKGEWLMGLVGIASIVAGVAALFILWTNPIVSMASLGLVVGINALVAGVSLLALSIKLRRWRPVEAKQASVETTPPTAASSGF